MFISIAPKLPMRTKAITKAFYVGQLGFADIGSADFDGYLLLKKDHVEIHFFEFKDLNPRENYSQVYIRTENINSFYQQCINDNITIHPNGHLIVKPWGQTEFSLLDPDHNLLTFGQSS